MKRIKDKMTTELKVCGEINGAKVISTVIVTSWIIQGDDEYEDFDGFFTYDVVEAFGLLADGSLQELDTDKVAITLKSQLENNLNIFGTYSKNYLV